MGKTVQSKAGDTNVTAELNETVTAQAIWDALPVQGEANRWGDEIYFSIPVGLEEEKPQKLVAMGDLGYWPPGAALCLFFGPTPASNGNEIRPASPVNVFGRINGDATVLKGVPSGARVVIDKGTEG